MTPNFIISQDVWQQGVLVLTTGRRVVDEVAVQAQVSLRFIRFHMMPLITVLRKCQLNHKASSGRPRINIFSKDLNHCATGKP